MHACLCVFDMIINKVDLQLHICIHGTQIWGQMQCGDW